MNASTYLQRRQTELIARVIRSLDYQGTPDDIAEAFALRLAEIHPQFDRVRFLEACGVQP